LYRSPIINDYQRIKEREREREKEITNKETGRPILRIRIRIQCSTGRTGIMLSSDEQHRNREETINTEEGGETSTTTTATTSSSIISKNDLIELIKAVKFANPEYSQRDVYKEIVHEIPLKFPQYATSVNETTIALNDVKKVWKKAVLQQQQNQNQKDSTNNNSGTNNNDLAERLRKMSTTPEVYTIGVGGGNGGSVIGGTSSSNTITGTGDIDIDIDIDITTTSASAAKEYIKLYLKEQHLLDVEKSRLILQDYVHVYLDVPADQSGSKPHQALINFQNNKRSSTNSDNKKKTIGGGKGNNKKKGGRGNKKTTTTTATATTVAVVVESSLPFDDAIIIKIQMAAPLSNDENEVVIKHPMLLYDKERKYKTFIHPNSTLTSSSSSSSGSSDNNNSSSSSSSSNDNNDDDDGYTRISNWINTNGIGGVLGSSGGTKAYFYSRLTETSNGNSNSSGSSSSSQRILSIYVKEIAPSKQEW
jgi:hypothetical protein